jgi:transcriptional regulator with XRE-family HTH domain
MVSMNDLGERIQMLRKQHNLTQLQLADKIGISHTQMARYEIKGVQPPANVLEKLADIFDTSIDYLVRGDKAQKVQSSLEDAELIKQFKQLDKLPDDEKKSILKVLSALIRDFNARQAYLV